MYRAGSLAAVLLLGLASTGVAGIIPGFDNLRFANRHLHGVVIDHTHHHGVDRRIWSQALCQKRDLYVYLPPGFDPCRRYPVMLWLHGFLQDENAFLEIFCRKFDRAICEGKIPPMIIAAPDGSLKGRASLLAANSFFLNTEAGNFEDYLIEDVWGFLISHYPIRPEREAHVVAGISMGGFAAYNQAMKHRDMFKVAVGIYPPLNLRWMDCHGRYFANFDPNCWAWREDVSKGREPIGRFFLGLVKVRMRHMIDPLFPDRGPDTVARLSYENPIEMLDRLCIQDGDLDMYVVFGLKDQFNLDAQIESFLFSAQQRGITVGHSVAPHGRHSTVTALRMLPNIIDWMGGVLSPYFNPDYCPPVLIESQPSE